MTQRIPQNFQRTTPAIASYSYTDVASGTGYVDYYLCATYTDTDDVDYILTESTNPGGYETSGGWGSNNSYVAFDLSAFNTPRYVKGVAILSGQVNYISDAPVVYFYVVHFDGTTETTIGTEAYQASDGADTNFNISTTISGKLFRKGDILRVYVKTSTAQAAGSISIDPSGTLPSGFLPTKISIPFRIDI